MLSIFRTNQLIFGILLLIYTLVVRSSIFFHNHILWTPNPSGILQEWLYTFIGKQGLLADIIALLIIFINANLINRLVFRHHLNLTHNLFPGLFYILISSASSYFLHFSSFHLANTFLLFAILFLYKLAPKSISIKDIFNVGFLISVASLFNFSYAIFLIWALIGISILQSFRFKKVLILLSGFIVPWFYVVVYFFWHGKLVILWQTKMFHSLKLLTFSTSSSFADYGTLLFIGMVCLLLLFTVHKNFDKQKFEVKKKLSILLWAVLFGLFPFLTSPHVSIENLLIFSIPAGIFMGFSFTQMNTKTAEVLHLLLFLYVILLPYEALFTFFK